MSLVRCPACGGTDLIEARDRGSGKPMPLVELETRGGKLIRREVGRCVACAACGTPFAVKPEGIVRTQRQAAPAPARAPRPETRETRGDADLLEALASTPIRPEPDDFR